MKQATLQPPSFEVAEWKTLVVPGLHLTALDRPLVKSLCESSAARLSVDELKDGLRVGAQSWIGVVRFQEFEVRIVPKLVGDNLQLVELIDYATGLDALKRYPAERSIAAAGGNLFDLIALLFAESCERALRNGLLSDYRNTEADLPVVRGRIMVERQILKRFGRLDRIECQYDEYLTDITENQILLAALSICATRVLNPTVLLRIRRLLAMFSEVCDISEFDVQSSRFTLNYHRMNEHYREPHGLAWMIFDGLGIKDIHSSGARRCFAFLLDMNQLFEAFVTRWLQQVLPRDSFKVFPQQRDRTILWNADLGRPHASIIPDVLVEQISQPGRWLPIDSKYKLYDDRNIVSGDIYQTFLYAYAYGEQHASLPTAIILYPASSPSSSQTRLHIRRQGGKASALLRTISLHIPTALVEAREHRKGPLTAQLLGVVQQTLASISTTEHSVSI